ncbi:MAG TPA: DUF3857 domain-containing protein [Chryseolinea sp.]
MKTALCLLILMMPFLGITKDDPKFPVSAIPENLKKNVIAVVREDEMVYTINADNRATLHGHYVVTVFNPKGDRLAEFSEWYSKLKKVLKFEGTVFNAHGTIIKRVKGNDVVDQGVYESGTLYTDTRVKSIDLSQSEYPYTVEFEYDVEYKFLYHINGSSIIPTENVAVQKASYQLIYPKALTPRYKTYNISQTPKVEQLDNGRESVSWRFENLPAIKFEPLSDPEDVLPEIVAAPGKFQYDGYSGSMETWEDYGKWQLSLNNGRDAISEETKKKVKQITSGLGTTEQKVKALYEFLQNRTRYVNISLGIGGLQPFEAMVVDKVGYGDCKGLSNYMIALLKEAGIKGYYTKIMAGEHAPEIDVTFPSHQTNHIIVGVPNGMDTLWLECTDQTNPFNFQGTFTGDRKAIMVTENGGKIVNTHRYAIEQNSQYRVADVFLEVNGDAKAKVKTTYSGLQYENDNLNFVLNKQYDDQRKWILSNTQIPSFDVVSFNMTNRKAKIPTAVVTSDFTLKRWATTSGKRIFITPNLMNRSTYIPEKMETRKTKVVTQLAYIDSDTIHYHIPDGIYPEFLPQSISIKSRFGEYEVSYKIDQNKLLYLRRIKMHKGEFPPESYSELVEFYKNVNKADNSKIVFLSKT